MFDVLRNIWEWFSDFNVSIFESIRSVFELIIKIFSDLPLFIKLTTAFSADVGVYVSWLPSSVVTIITLTIGLVICYKFFGRT